MILIYYNNSYINKMANHVFTEDKFNFDIIKDKINTLGNFNAMILGGSGTGKTTLIKNMLNILEGEFQYIFLFINTEHGAIVNYSRYIPFNHCFPLENIEDPDKRKNYIKNTVSKITKFLQLHTTNVKILIVTDDLGNNTKKYYGDLLDNCRHDKVSNIILLHEPKQIFSQTSVQFFFLTDVKIAIDENMRKIYKKIDVVVTDILNKYKIAVICDTKIYFIEKNDLDCETEKSYFMLKTDSEIKRKLRKYFKRLIIEYKKENQIENKEDDIIGHEII